MDLGLISVRYARALLKAGIETGLSEKVYADMQALATSYAAEPRLKATIDNPMVSKRQKEALLNAAASEKPAELTQRFFKLVIKEGREDIMQFIANSFITLYRKHNNLVSAKLTTAAPLDATTESKLRQLVEKKTNGTVEFKTAINSNLIGGFVLEYDTYRMDASVKTQLGTILSKLS